MAEIVNLNRVRKARLREEEQARAAANRVRFGQDKASRESRKTEALRQQRELDGKRTTDES